MDLFPTLKVEEWEAVQYDWIAPLATMLEDSDYRDNCGIWTKQKGPVRSLLQVIALNGFAKLSEAALGRFARSMGWLLPGMLICFRS